MVIEMKQRTMRIGLPTVSILIGLLTTQFVLNYYTGLDDDSNLVQNQYLFY